MIDDFSERCREVTRAILSGHAEAFVDEILPGGRWRGRRYECSGVSGGQGDSLKVCRATGRWRDFASSAPGGHDLVSLYAAARDVTQAEALRALSDRYGVMMETKAPTKVAASKPPVRPCTPPGVPPASLVGKHHGLYEYRLTTGELAFYVGRYDGATGKRFVPFVYTSNGWVKRGYPVPRPLYNGQNVDTAFVLIVEGEKVVDAMRPVCSRYYTPVTWPNGALAWGSADWSAVYGRRVLIVPDADEAGRRAGQGIAEMLRFSCPEIKIVDTHDMPSSWDLADVAWGDWSAFATWAKDRLRTFKPLEAPKMEAPGEVDRPAVSLRDLGATFSGSGRVVINEGSLVAILSNWDATKGRIWLDRFHSKVLTTYDGELREWGDREDGALTIALQRTFLLHGATEQRVARAVRAYASTDERCEPLDWLAGLTWDGVERVGGFFPTYYGTADDAYHRAISHNFLVSLVARITSPGCQMDTMVIIEGKQGLLKTSSLRVIGGKWYASLNTRFDGKDFLQEIQGALLVEVAELSSFSRTEAETLKANLSKTFDRFRPAYDRHVRNFPRQCVFVGTTNQQHYLRDTTGARRFWPLRAQRIDMEGLTRDREQLFAEARVLYERSATWWVVPESAEDEQDQRLERDYWEDVLREFLKTRTGGEVTPLEVAIQGLGLERGKLDVRVSRRIHAVMRRLGWAAVDRVVEGRRSLVFEAPDRDFFSDAD